MLFFGFVNMIEIGFLVNVIEVNLFCLKRILLLIFLINNKNFNGFIIMIVIVLNIGIKFYEISCRKLYVLVDVSKNIVFLR